MKENNDKAADPVGQRSPTEGPASASLFGDDDLGRVQGILFGNHAKHTIERIDTLEGALLGVIDDLRSEMHRHVTDLNDRITAEADTSERAANNLASRLKEGTETRANADAALAKDIDATTLRLTDAIDETGMLAARSLDQVRTEVIDQIEAAESELRDRKVDRDALAALLTTTAKSLSDDQ